MNLPRSPCKSAVISTLLAAITLGSACAPRARESTLQSSLARTDLYASRNLDRTGNGTAPLAETTAEGSPESTAKKTNRVVTAPSARRDGKVSVNPHPTGETSAARPLSPSPPEAPNLAMRIMERLGLLTFFSRPYPQAMGATVRGTLKNPDQLPWSSDGVLKLFRKRDRGYGTLDLLTLVKDAARELHRDLPAAESVQVGDIAAKRGGPVGGHGSHQNGLDADIVFFRRDHRTMDPLSAKANVTGFDESFVDPKGRVTANFDVETNWRFIQLLESTGRVDRIFVDGNLKKTFCEYAVAKGMRPEWKETLRKLRHWPNHRDHLHLRISCPSGSADCVASAPIPAGDGCDSLIGRENVGAFLSFDGASGLAGAAKILGGNGDEGSSSSDRAAETPEDGC